MENPVSAQPTHSLNFLSRKRLIYSVLILLILIVLSLVLFQQKFRPQQSITNTLNEDLTLKKVDVETLTVYYSSTSSAALAKNTIENYREKLTNGSLTFEQTGKEISENPTLTSLSPFNKDAYGKYKNVQKNMRVYPDANLSAAIFEAQVGIISPVLEVFNSLRNKDGGFVQQSVGFTIYKVTNNI